MAKKPAKTKFELIYFIQADSDHRNLWKCCFHNDVEVGLVSRFGSDEYGFYPTYQRILSGNILADIVEFMEQLK